jgi:hypothetical protein
MKRILRNTKFAILFTSLCFSQSIIYAQFKVILTEGITVYKPTLFEKQLLQYAFRLSPDYNTGKFSGNISKSDMANGYSCMKFDTYSAPKSNIYGQIFWWSSKMYENPIFPQNLREKYLEISLKFCYTYELSERLHKIRDVERYKLYLDSLNLLISPHYKNIDSIGRQILDSIEYNITYVKKTNTFYKRNTSLDKINANKFWESSYTLFDAFNDKPIKLNLSNDSKHYYSLFILQEDSDIDSLINLRSSDIKNDYSSRYRNTNYYPQELSKINGIKFEDFETFYKWAKVKYPEKFVNTQVTKSQTSTTIEQSKNVEPSENKNLSAFLKLLASSPSNSSTTNLKGSKNCIECNGTGKCRICSKTFQKPYFKNGYYAKRSETKVGYTLCNLCLGKGFQDRNIGSGYEIIGDCSNQKCQDGWVFCYKCNSSGQRNDIGQCRECRGTGRK